MQLTNRQVGWVLGFSLTVVAIPASGLALTVQEVPNPRKANGGWVTDMADILSPTTEAQLNQIVSELEAKKGAEFAIVTVPQTTPASTPKEFATELFNTWKIGKQGQDNGLLLLISKGDRRIEIETGYGLEGVLTDAKVGQIIDRDIKPKFKQGDFDGGTLAGTQALVAIVSQSARHQAGSTTTVPQLAVEPTVEDSSWLWQTGLILGSGLACGSIVFSLYYRQKKSKCMRQQTSSQYYSDYHHLHQRPTNPRLPIHSHNSKRLRPRKSGRPAKGYGWELSSTSDSYRNSWTSDNSSSSSYDSSSSSSYSDSSSSYSSSDFGGGSSGGGGAGSDF